ncbi:fluoride efflux transporter CrcB [Pediococcus ethanolidurans]|uniref:fluoride efflux transporter CrcB n=1 Tax=Pediococcus ethanolidurans TaxID=319653 RepID=UPI002955ADFE|nr:fluoride efflux transporter CrcB [Pediococcus ethanolidurans]MDV7718907.1 fluoride efflux transporter CrcB [Pediococcus ethanolidurans]
MMTVSLIGVGASVGAITRYELTKIIKKRIPSYFPFGTLIINILACFVIGILAATTLESSNWYAIMAIGFCGGLSTFSTMSLETMVLLQERRYRMAVEYILFSLVIGIMAVSLGALIC